MMWLTDMFIDYVPMYSKFRTVESILVVAEFTMPLLAMMALQKLFANRDDSARFSGPVMWSFGITLVLCLLGLVAPSLFGSVISENDRMIDSMITQQLLQQGYPQDAVRQFSLESPAIYSAVESLREGLVRSDALRSFIIVAAGLILLVLYMRRRLNLAVAAAGIGIIILGDLFLVNRRYLDHESFVPRKLTVGPPVEMTVADREILKDTVMNYRVMDLARFSMADPSYYHKMIGGYHAAKLTRYQDLIDTHLSRFLSAQPDSADFNVLNMLNARYVVMNPAEAPILNEEAYGNAWLVDEVKYVADADNEMNALSYLDLRHEAVADARFRDVLGNSAPAAPGDTIFETTYAPNRLTYHVDSRQGGVAVFSEVYFPWGWKAEIDGKPAELGRVNYLLRALRIPAGSHTVTMTFDPESIHTTVNLARVCIIIIYLGVAAAIVFAIGGCPCRCRNRAKKDA